MHRPDEAAINSVEERIRRLVAEAEQKSTERHDKQQPRRAAAPPPQQQSAREYLEENVLFTLLQGLKVLARERPENPVDALAMHLLKHNPNKSSTVEVPLN